MTGTKTNERPGTRARLRYVRVSAHKAREVLDLIRGRSYGEASEILQFSERAVAQPIRKVLDSAVANAEHNDALEAEELYVSACYADEGPTLKRWRPRARGRATRIRKRTCHITIIVARYDDDRLEAIRRREESVGRSGSAQAAEARRRRVARSKERAEAAEHDHDDEETTDEVGADEEVDVEKKAAEVTAATLEALEPDDSSADDAVDTVVAIDDDDEQTAQWPGSVAAPEDGSMPDGYPVKGNADSMRYHEPGGRWYDKTIAEVFFASAEAAEAAGFTKAGSRKMSDDSEHGDS